jgi:hypothetical protein
MTGGTLIVDGANVVGSRPDGWWRDRAGAARRLYEGLTAAFGVPEGDDGGAERPARVVLVLEGAARAGVPAGSTMPAAGDGATPAGGVLVVVHAAGSGDDAIVEQASIARRPVLVVTADRALRARLTAIGAQVTGPTWLWGRLGRSA